MMRVVALLARRRKEILYHGFGVLYPYGAYVILEPLLPSHFCMLSVLCIIVLPCYRFLTTAYQLYL